MIYEQVIKSDHSWAKIWQESEKHKIYGSEYVMELKQQKIVGSTYQEIVGWQTVDTSDILSANQIFGPNSGKWNNSRCWVLGFTRLYMEYL